MGTTEGSKLTKIQRVRLIRSPKAGKNALDFVLAYHLAELLKAGPEDR